MPQPTPYALSFSFTDFQASNPSTPLPGYRVDAEFNAAGETLDGVLANLALIQRDDGHLANQTVGLDTISPALVAALHTIGAEVGVWATGTAYTPGAFMVSGAVVYMAVTAHTSAALLATDVAAGRMIAVFGGAVGGVGITDGDKGDVIVSGLGTIFTLAASLALTGNPTAATQVLGNNSTRLATTAFVQAAVAALVNASPAALDTLKELADALGDDANFAATMTTALAGKQGLDADLTAIAALTTTAYGRSLLELANAAALRTLAGVVIGTDVQAYDPDLAAIAALVPAQGDVIYYDGAQWQRLAAGTAGLFLKTLGAGSNPVWASATSVPWDFAPPPAAAFTLFSGDGTAATKADDADVGLTVTTGAASTGLVARGAYKALPAGDFTLTVGFKVDADNVSPQGAGMVMYESATSKAYELINFGTAADGYQFRKQLITGGGAGTFNYSSYHLRQGLFWLRFSRTGTNLKVEFSYTGKKWFTAISEAQTAYFTTAPDRIGPAVWLGHASAIPSVYVQYWNQSW